MSSSVTPSTSRPGPRHAEQDPEAPGRDPSVDAEVVRGDGAGRRPPRTRVRWTRFVVLCAAVLLLTTAGAAVLSAAQPPTWAAEVDLLHEAADPSSAEGVQREMATQQVLLLRRPLIEDAAAAVGRDPESLLDDVNVEIVEDSAVLQLQVRDRDEERARETVQYLADHYLESAGQPPDSPEAPGAPDAPAAPDIGTLRVLGEPWVLDEPVAPEPLRAAAAGFLLGSVLVVVLLVLARRQRNAPSVP